MNNINWNELKRKNDVCKFDIDNLSFSYKPISQGELYENYNYFMEGEPGKRKMNLVKVFISKLINLSLEIPAEVIKEWLQLKEPKEFDQLNRDDKYKLLNCINKKDLVIQLINKIQTLDSPNSEVKKNL